MFPFHTPSSLDHWPFYWQFPCSSSWPTHTTPIPTTCSHHHHLWRLLVKSQRGERWSKPCYVYSPFHYIISVSPHISIGASYTHVVNLWLLGYIHVITSCGNMDTRWLGFTYQRALKWIDKRKWQDNVSCMNNKWIGLVNHIIKGIGGKTNVRGVWLNRWVDDCW